MNAHASTTVPVSHPATGAGSADPTGSPGIQHPRQSNESTTPDTAGGLTARTGVAPPDPALVWRLQSERSEAAISLLLNTSPGSVMADADRKRLRALIAKVQGRLRTGSPSEEIANLLTVLDRMADAAVAEETGASLAIFVNGTVAERLRLPVQVSERIVIEPTFATRDLVRAMHRTPPHAVLVLSEREAHLYTGVAGKLQRAVARTFPMSRGTGVSGQTDGPGSEDTKLPAFLDTVDTALGAYLAVHPTPVVVVAPATVLSTFTGLSCNLARLAGTLTGDLATVSLAELSTRIGPIIESYLRSRQQEAFQLLERRTAQERTASGIAAAWLAARRERPEMLAVEEGLFVPARLSADGDYVTPAEGVEHPDVIDDLVDELIETVLHRGGWIALVGDGELAAHDGVALTVRR